MKATTIASARHRLKRWLVLGSLWGGMMMSLTSAVHTQSLDPEEGFTNVTINGTRLSDDEVGAIEQQYRVQVPDGSYWYDKFSGDFLRDQARRDLRPAVIDEANHPRIIKLAEDSGREKIKALLEAAIKPIDPNLQVEVQFKKAEAE